MQSISHVHFFFPHKAVPLIHVSHFLFLSKPLHHPVDCHPLRIWYPCILFPNTGKIPDKMICPALACFVFFSRFLYFSTIAVVPSLSVLFVPTCTSMDPPYPLPMICSTLSVTCSILAPGKQTTTSSPCSILYLSSEL